MTSPTVEQLVAIFKYPGNKQEAIHLLSAFPDKSEIKNIKDDKDYSKRYLIHLAAQWGWTDIVELLATKYNCSPNCTDQVGRTSLHWACGNNLLGTVKLLTTQYFLDPLQATKGGSTPLDYSSGETRKYLEQIIGKCVCLYVFCFPGIFVLY